MDHLSVVETSFVSLRNRGVFLAPTTVLFPPLLATECCTTMSALNTTQWERCLAENVFRELVLADANVRQVGSRMHEYR